MVKHPLLHRAWEAGVCRHHARAPAALRTPQAAGCELLLSQGCVPKHPMCSLQLAKPRMLSCSSDQWMKYHVILKGNTIKELPVNIQWISTSQQKSPVFFLLHSKGVHDLWPFELAIASTRMYAWAVSQKPLRFPMTSPEGNTVLGHVAVLLTQEDHLSMLTTEQSKVG